MPSAAMTKIYIPEPLMMIDGRAEWRHFLCFKPDYGKINNLELYKD